MLSGQYIVVIIFTNLNTTTTKMKKLQQNSTLAKSQSGTTSDNYFTAKFLTDCRFKFRNPETFEVTSVYLTRTVKIFRGGKCLISEYIEGESFADILNKISVTIFNL